MVLDFIKNDCVYANYVPDQIAAVSAAIDASGRQMLYSLSPGADNNDWAKTISGEVSMYRVTGDTWDRWDNIKSHFLSAQHMQPYIAHPNGRYGLPSWPDLDSSALCRTHITALSRHFTHSFPDCLSARV
jgi:alpha-galactosidase